EDRTMTFTAQATPAPSISILPPCFCKIESALAKEIGLEIYETLRSATKLPPEPYRKDVSCPAEMLGERKAKFIMYGVLAGRHFRALEMIETDTVKFVGAAAGALEAARLGAFNCILKKLFFTR